MSGLTTSAKLDAIAASGLQVLFDGCHKIYIVETPADLQDAKDVAWWSDDDLHPASEIRDLIKQSCGLVLVHPWNLRKDHPWDIEQGTDDIFEA